jgi:predicted dehydrogenase
MSYETGLVGLSGIGTRHQVGYAATEGIDLVAIADVDDELLARHGDAWDIPEERRYADHAELLAAEDLDAVSIATPSFLHHEHVLDAVDSAADPDVVWCEKPIAVSVSEAYEMLAACEEADVDLLIDHTRRFSETYRRLHEAINEAEVLGEVQSVHVQSPEELLRNGTHMVDLLTYLLDERFERVMGHLTDAGGGDLDDSGGGGVAITESGTYVNVDATTSREITTGDWLVVGDEGKLEFSEYAGEIGYWRLEDSDEGSSTGTRRRVRRFRGYVRRRGRERRRVARRNSGKPVARRGGDPRPRNHRRPVRLPLHRLGGRPPARQAAPGRFDPVAVAAPVGRRGTRRFVYRDDHAIHRAIQ